MDGMGHLFITVVPERERGSRSDEPIEVSGICCFKVIYPQNPWDW